MSETNWRNWIILFLIALGFTFEIMKRTNFHPETSLEAAAAAGVTEPYSVSGRDRARNKRAHQVDPQSTKVGANSDKSNRELLEKFIAANAAGSTTFDGAKKVDEKKKKEECDEKNPKIDPLTGKPIACKKKKDKKEEAKVEAPPAPPAPKEKTKNDDSFYAQSMPGGGVGPQAQVQNQNETFTTLEEWERRLLNAPDAAETKRFIDKFNQNLVTAEVFYKIAQEMLDDSREDMRRLGVMCAGQTPSTTSFDLLASLIKKEASGSGPRRDAEVYVGRYANLSNVRFLETLLRTPSANTYTTVLATQKVGDSAKHYLNLPTATAATNVTTGAPATTSAATTAQIAAVKKNATYFTRFLGILQDLSRNGDAGIKGQAATTLTSIQSLLTTVQQQPNTPVASTN